MEAIRLHTVVERDGEISVTGLPYKKGQHVEMILLVKPAAMPRRPRMIARQLLNSSLIGLWRGRRDIENSTTYARQLREQAQRRQG